MKNIFYSQIRGRREGDTETKYKFDWWKLLIVPLIGWATWITIHGFLAEQNQAAVEQLKKGSIAELKNYVDMQVGVLHGRATGISVGQEADETRLENRLWELQLRFFEDEIEDCEEELEKCKE